MKYEITSLGIRFTKGRAKEQTPFERLFEIFKELIKSIPLATLTKRLIGCGSHREYQLTDENYTIDDLVEDLLKKPSDPTQRK